jgi:hypothetical protein
MKKCLSPDDVMELSETQKSALRDLWQPNKYDLAVEIVWKDVENDLYDGVVLLVANVGVRVIHTQHCEVLLKVLYLDSPPQYDNLNTEAEPEEPDDSDYDDDDEDFTETEETADSNMETDFDNNVQEALSTDHYLSKESCLPLLSIGQMIEILEKHKSELNISFTPEEALCYIDGREYVGDELCDALWEAVKDLLN